MKQKLLILFIVVVWVLFGIIAAQTAFDCHTKTVIENRIDTLRISSEPDTILSPVLKVKYVYTHGDTVVITDTLYKVIERYKYLKNVLGEHDVKELLQFDTTAQLRASVNDVSFVLPATIHTTTDCINSRIMNVVKLDTTRFTIPIKTIIEQQNPTWSFGVGIGYGATASGALVPNININLSHVIWSF